MIFPLELAVAQRACGSPSP